MTNNKKVFIDSGETFYFFFKAFKILLSRQEYRKKKERQRRQNRDEDESTSTDEDDEDVMEKEDVTKNKEFLEIFKKQYWEGIKRLKFRYDVPYKSLYFVKDSPRELNWRKQIFEEYKANRKETKYKSQLFNLSELFKHFYSSILPPMQKEFQFNIIQVEHAEADDVISIIVKNIGDDTETYIISSDTDYLQLLKRDNIFLENINGVQLNKKLGGKTPEYILEKKILSGDKSDNIPPCFPNKALVKHLLDEPEYLEKTLEANDSIRQAYERNRILIDFDYIPYEIQQNIMQEYENCHGWVCC